MSIGSQTQYFQGGVIANGGSGGQADARIAVGTCDADHTARSTFGVIGNIGAVGGRNINTLGINFGVISHLGSYSRIDRIINICPSSGKDATFFCKCLGACYGRMGCRKDECPCAGTRQGNRSISAHTCRGIANIPGAWHNRTHANNTATARNGFRIIIIIAYRSNAQIRCSQ